MRFHVENNPKFPLADPGDNVTPLRSHILRLSTPSLTIDDFGRRCRKRRHNFLPVISFVRRSAALVTFSNSYRRNKLNHGSI